MCGFLGEIKYDDVPVKAEEFAYALDLMASRGPDARGIWSGDRGRVMLGHRRLAVIDLDVRSNQPFVDRSGRYCLVYNGEIYNFAVLRDELSELGHSFYTQSDTEVLLAALLEWGTAALARLSGMFAFALWDGTERRLLLARDRIGVKPIYVDVGVLGRVAFASTLGPLLHISGKPRELDLPALASYLQTLYIPTPHSAIKGIIKLPAGSFMEVGPDSNPRQVSWWSPFDKISVSLPDTQDDLVDFFDDELRKAVRSRLVSDVPIGVLLSGGIDSSLITAHMAAETTGTVNSFTIAFESSEYDESEVAEEVARHLGTHHHVLTATADGLLDFVDKFTDYFDEPFADVSAFPMLLVSHLTRKQVTVALCGDGGDELFGGYNYYSWLQMYQRALRVPRLLRRSFSAIAPLLGSRLAMAVAAVGKDDTADIFTYMRATSKAAVWDRLTKCESLSVSNLIRQSMHRRRHPDVRVQAMAADLLHYLPDDILVKGDRATMAASLEARHPFLDINVVEGALSLDPEWMFRDGQGKWILRQMLKKYVPVSITDRPKHGFTVPIRQWFRQRLRPLLDQLLSQENLQSDPLLDRREVHMLYQEHLQGRRNHENLLWAIVVYKLWLENNKRYVSLSS